MLWDMSYRCVLCVLFLFLLPLFLLPAASVCAAELALTDLRIIKNGMKTRVLLDTNGAAPYRAFALNDPPRLVIDLPVMAWQAPMNKGDRNGYIKAYRKGIFQKDTLRVVFDLNKPIAIEAHKRVPPAGKGPWQYAFELVPVSATAFQQSLGAIATGGGASEIIQKTTTVTTITDTVTTAPPDAPPLAPPLAPTLVAPTSRKPLIVIDAGHGGVDPGAIATNGAYEKNITLATAKEVRRLMEASGNYRVHLTRETDIFIKLPERVKIARAKGADMFISLHADTIGRSAVSGASVYTLSDKASDVETAKLAARENAVDNLINVNVGTVDADVADILIDLVTRDTMNQSRVLAETVVSTFKAQGVKTLPQNPHRSAGFAVLKAPDIPSVLIEMGYLSNRQEADNLNKAAYRTKLATAITKVIERYFSETSKTAMY